MLCAPSTSSSFWASTPITSISTKAGLTGSPGQTSHNLKRNEPTTTRLARCEDPGFSLCRAATRSTRDKCLGCCGPTSTEFYYNTSSGIDKPFRTIDLQQKISVPFKNIGTKPIICLLSG